MAAGFEQLQSRIKLHIPYDEFDATFLAFQCRTHFGEICLAKIA
jgi:hypothetical protein